MATESGSGFIDVETGERIFPQDEEAFHAGRRRRAQRQKPTAPQPNPKPPTPQPRS